jgi:hypothetical protein
MLVKCNTCQYTENVPDDGNLYGLRHNGLTDPPTHTLKNHGPAKESVKDV